MILKKKEESSFLYFDDNLIYCKITEKEPVLTSMVNYVRKISPPRRNEVERLYPQIENGNLYARNRLFEMYMRNVLKFAYQQSLEFNLNLADTIQDGMMGLHIAVDKYSPYMHGKFPAYSYFWIKSTIDVHKKIENSLWDIPNNKLIDVENLYKYLRKYIPSFFENPRLTDSFVKEIADMQQLPIENVKRYRLDVNSVDNEREFIVLSRMGFGWYSRNKETLYCWDECTEMVRPFVEYLFSAYYVSQDLIDLEKNGFKSEEEIRFKQQQWLTWVSIAVALVIGLLGIFIK